ncbi:MAG: HAD family hydrolase [Bacillota bacterium]
MLPKVIFFDLDDTIISFQGASDKAWQETCDRFVEELNLSFSSARLYENIRKEAKWYWDDPERHRIGRMDMNAARRDIVTRALKNLEHTNEADAAKITDGFIKLQSELVCLFPKSVHTLEKLREKGVRMALITNGTSLNQRGKLQRFNLTSYFEYILIEEEVGFGKPDERVYKLALELMKVSPEDVWMVGDNLVWDVDGAQRLGIYSIWNNYKKLNLPENSEIIPDRTIYSIDELLGEL